MSSDKFIVKKGIKLESNSTASDANGEVRFDGTDLKFYSTSEKTLATTADISAHTGDSADAHAASAITNTPAGGIAATTVQAAIDELDSDKVAKVSSTDEAVVRFNGINGAVQDSGVTIDDTNNMIVPGNLRSDGATIDLADATTASIATTNSASTINIGSGSGANTINIGGASSTVNITGSVNNQNVTNLNVSDKLITINDGGGAASGGAAGIEIEENSSVTGYIKTSSDRNSFEIKAPNTNGIASLTPGASNDTITMNAATQTLTNKTLTTPTTDVITLDGQASTPSSPASGYYKLYAKDDGKVYKLNSSGTEAEIGSGGSSGINYIQQGGGNHDAEGNATTGWTTYADAAATSPVDGTGGSPTATWTVTSTTPLRGTYSFLLTKDAANRQGEGVGYAFTIDKADKGKVLQGSFEYAISSGTFADDDVSIWIYDVTNATLIQPAPYKLKNHSLDSEKFGFEFQTSSSSTSYRLIVHIASTSASAYTIKFDNFNVGPQAKLYGSPVTDWVSFTPTGSWSSNTTYTGFWRRIGDSAEYKVVVAVSGAPTSATLTVNLASGHTIDTAKLDSTVAITNILGEASVFDTGTKSYTVGNVGYNNTTSVAPCYDDGAGGAAQITQAAPMTFASGDKIYLKFKVPIVGWSSSVVMSSDADVRVVAAKATFTSAQNSGNGTWAKVSWGVVGYDTHGAISSSTYTVKVPGTYRVTSSVRFNSMVSTEVGYLAVYKNGAATEIIGELIAPSNGNHRVGGTCLLPNLIAGDTIEIYSQTSSAARALETTATYNWFNVERLSGPAQIAASETVAWSGYTTATTSITNTGTQVTSWSTIRDTHGAFSTGTSTYTVPVSGWYNISGNLYFAAQASTAQHNAMIYKNGSQLTSGAKIPNNSGTQVSAPYSAIDYFNAGDAITIYGLSTTTTALTAGSQTGQGRWSIHRVGI